MPNISLVMIVKDEEEHLNACLDSAKNYVSEIVIVDTGSTDNTIEIARDYGAKVYEYTWTNDFAAARNFALSKSMSDWNLILDADERIMSWDKDKVNSLLQGKHFIGKVNIKSNFLQNNEERYSQIFVSRLLPKGIYYSGRIHEQAVSDLPRIDLPIDLFHAGYFQTDKSERNLAILKEELSKDPNNAYILYQLARQYKTMNLYEETASFFRKSYQAADRSEGYFTDLTVNYIYTLTELKKYYPAFEIIDQMNVPLGNSPDFQFVCGIFYLDFVLSDVAKNIDFLPLIERSYLICLALGEQKEREIVVGTGSFLAAYNLGVYYEMCKQTEKAKHYYEFSAAYKYKPAEIRLLTLLS
ncbi:glycosyltransferase family 2 protein [Bacillus sp. JJ1773]|uniref:glycosyltransferase family 2 protein n=1 Tax=Bacillus sp. JJ1773 TaxID=3122965 RepID=UPI003000A2FE